MPPESSEGRQTRELLDRALELVGVERETFLDVTCGEDTELRAEVDALLAELGTSAPIELEPDEQVGPYRLLEVLGEGGFGRVYKAEQREPVRRLVALKVIKLGMDTRQIIARFEAERQALSMMSHPNIAQVLDVGSTELGRPYFVMELVRGVSITDYCERNQLDVDARLGLFMTVCSALQHAHQKGVIHRDIKPSNVLVSAEGERPVAKVIDFGIAKATHRALTDKTLVTLQRQVIGTPIYMPPEQADQTGLDVDTRSDIYALGALLYELLTGAPPFDRGELEALSHTEMLRIIRDQDPQRPSDRVQAAHEEAKRRRPSDPDLQARLRGDLDWIVMRCLEKDRTRRYETASELVAEIRRHLDDEPVLAGPPSTIYRMGKFVRRNRSAVTVAGVVVGLLLVGVVVTTSLMFWALGESARADAAAEKERAATTAAQQALHQAQREAERADVADERADDALATSLRMSEFVETQVDALDPLDLATHLRARIFEQALGGSGGDPARRAVLEEALAAVSFTDVTLAMVQEILFTPTLDVARADWSDMPIPRAQLEQSTAKALYDLGLYADAEAPQRLALQILSDQLGDDEERTLKARLRLADVLAGLARYDEALLLIDECLERHTQVRGERSWQALQARTSRATVLHELGRHREARRELEAVLDGVPRGSPEYDRVRLNAQSQLGQTLYLLQEWHLAEKAARDAVNGWEALQDAPPAQLLGARNTLALARKMVGAEGAALELLRQQYAECREVLGTNRRLSIMAALNLGSMLLQTGSPEEAEPLVLDAVARNEALHGRNHRFTCEARHVLGRLRKEQGRYDEAAVILHDAWLRMSEHHQPAHQETLDIAHTLSELLLYGQRPSDARHVVVQVAHTARRALPADDPRRERALALASGLIRHLDETGPPREADNDSFLGWFSTAASAYSALDQHSDAEDLLVFGLERAPDASPAALAEARSILGEARARSRPSEAYPLLLESFETLEALPGSRETQARLAACARRLARYFEDRDDSAMTAAWRERARSLQSPDA